MNRLSALALATAALALGAEAQAQTRDGWRMLNWPAKRDEAASAAAARPLVMGAPRENRYSARRSAPATTRTVAAPIASAPTYSPAPAYSPPPAAVARAEAAPQRLPRPSYEAAAPVVARQTPRPSERVLSEQPGVHARKPAAVAAAAKVDPEWTVREELMSHIPPAPAAKPVAQPVLRAEPKAAPATVATAETEPKAAPAKGKTSRSKTAKADAKAAKGGKADGKAAPGEVKTAAAPPAPLEPWRTRSDANGPRFYSLHRQFGVTPDQARATAPTGAAADPLPSAFFAASASTPADRDEEENAAEDARLEAIAAAKQEEQAKKKRRK